MAVCVAMIKYCYNVWLIIDYIIFNDCRGVYGLYFMTGRNSNRACVLLL